MRVAGARMEKKLSFFSPNNREKPLPNEDNSLES
jgi:hypothetical protein